MRFNQRTRNKSIRIVSMACIRSASGSNIYEYLWIYEIKNISNGTISIALKSPNDTLTHRINLKEYYINTVYFS